MAASVQPKYQPYPAYKHSGVEWLGDIPEGWELFRLKHLATKPLMYGANEAALDNNVNNPRFIRITDIKDDGGLNDETFRSLKPEIAEPYLLERGDILLARSGATVGKSFIYSPDWGKCCFAGYLIKANIDPNRALATWVYRYTQTKYFWDWIDSIQIQATIQNVSAEKYNSFLIAVPPLPEQIKIAAFLDYETARIDALIAKQQRLIALLEEKRQAVISHAVTKGLNPNAPMRPSGTDWLGDVPAHWEVSRLGWISSVVRGGSPRPAGDPALFDGDFSPWVTVAEITKDEDINLWETATFLTKRGSEQCRVFSKRTLLLSNSGGSLGVPKILQINANANDGVLGFEQLSANISLAYYYLSTLTKFFRDSIKSSGGSTQINLNTDILKQLPIPVPPTNSEQESIVSFIEERVETFRALTIKSQSAMVLLKERRTALTSAAVTGKIDVRNWRPPPSESNQNLETAKDAVA